MEFEGHHDPEISPAAAQRPNQIRIFLSTGADQLAVGGDHICCQKIVAAETMRPAQPADASGQGQSRNPGGRNQTTGRCPTERRGSGVHVKPGGPTFHHGPVQRGRNSHAVHQGKVNHHAAITDRIARHIMASAADANRKARILGVADRCGNIRGIAASYDQCGPPVDHRIPDAAQGVIVGVRGLDQFSTKRGAQ